jgi:hypothetical protein
MRGRHLRRPSVPRSVKRPLDVAAKDCGVPAVVGASSVYGDTPTPGSFLSPLATVDAVGVLGPQGSDLLDTRPAIPAFARALRFSW